MYSANAERFYNEIEVLKSIDHPHVVKIYEVVEDSKNYHIVTELLSGGELLDFMLNQDTITEATAAAIMT